MKKLLFTFVFLLGAYSFCDAGKRETGLTKPTISDGGNIIDAMAITVSSTTPTRILYSSNPHVSTYRSLMFQNTSTNTFRVYIGTHSAITTTSGGRWFIPAGGSWTTTAKDDLWALFDAASTGICQVLGQFERDSADRDTGQ